MHNTTDLIKELETNWGKLTQGVPSSYYYKMEALGALKARIEKHRHDLDKAKTFWERLKNFLGFYSVPDESVLITWQNRIDTRYQFLRDKWDELIYPRNLFVRVLRWLGIDLWGVLLKSVTHGIKLHWSNWFNWAFSNNNQSAVTFKGEAFHLMGQNRYRGNDIEGMTQSLAAKNLVNKLVEFIQLGADLGNTPAKEKIWAAHNILKRYEELSKNSLNVELLFSMGSTSLHPQRVEELTQQIVDQIDSLKPSELIIIPAGFISKQGGHAVCYALECKADGSYQLSLYNTGAGLMAQANQLSRYEWLKNKWKGFWGGTNEMYFELSHCDLAQLKSAFASSVVRTSTTEVDTIGQGIEMMLRPIQLIVKNGNKSKQGHYYKKQVNGTCVESCLLAWLEGYLGTDLHELFYAYLVKSACDNVRDLEKQGKLRHVKAAVADQKGGLVPINLQGYALVQSLLANGQSILRARQSEFDLARRRYQARQTIEQNRKASAASRIAYYRSMLDTTQIGASQIQQEYESAQKTYLSHCSPNVDPDNPPAPGIWAMLVSKEGDDWSSFREKRKAFEVEQALRQNKSKLQECLEAAERSMEDASDCCREAEALETWTRLVL